MTTRLRRQAALGLVNACHPLPTLAVTTMTAVFVDVVGNSVPTIVLATLAVLTGQLSIGWSNDAIDAHRDRAVGRADKPVAAGAVSVEQVWSATWAATAATVVFSAALGWRAGLVSLSVVACGWLYNVTLKSSPLSPLPFFVAFGSLPAIATLSLPEHVWPPGWALLAGGLLGVAAHFGNVLPDLDEDRETGVSGLPHRLGRVTSTTVAITGGVIAAELVVVASRDTGSPLTLALALAALGCAVAGLVVVRRDPHSEAAFFAIIGIAAIVVALLATSDAIV